jgi:hypothetical protein
MTGTPAAELWHMPGPVFAAFEDEARAAAWTHLHELIAIQTETLHGVYRLLIGALSRTNPPEQLSIPRPHDPKPRRIVVTAGEMAAMLTGRRGGGNR